ncbi:hypothetical protein A3A49_01555 [Candidatus Curtissbacteria bacterium RIFCSPLOWO2_01_FULL_38_11b]|uniref:DUF2283 domain-containing protein n=1 Tax=Candidatus Curtissbacteria bacterium RIFCSPLOWO2_01_FULL_38_11b TaxID=1797725 RepID=A0A1F5H139_9BACT|nr:MAG: hypothetical protein A3A49_01555 [Candidatus Curtissbacteria bacterium RIFCSPLOWO2_01_FULL_38_11b]
MRAKYYQEDDLLVIELVKKAYVEAEKIGSFIVHYDKNKQPVLVEILNASKLLKETSKALPTNLRQSIFSAT